MNEHLAHLASRQTYREVLKKGKVLLWDSWDLHPPRLYYRCYYRSVVKGAKEIDKELTRRRRDDAIGV